jgi:hypothetical protein
MTDSSDFSPYGGFRIGTIFLGIMVWSLGCTAFALAMVLLLLFNLGMDGLFAATRRAEWFALFTFSNIFILCWTSFLAGKRSPGGEYINASGIGLYIVACNWFLIEMQPALTAFADEPHLYPDWYLQTNLILIFPFALMGAYCATRSNQAALEEALNKPSPL